MALFADQKQKNIATYQKAIDDKKISIKKYFDEIGRLYYGQYKDNSVDVTKDINARCDSVTKLSAEIEELNLRILYEKGLKRCPACKQDNALEYTFCFKCGNKFDESALPLSKQKKPAPAPVVEAEEVATEEVIETVEAEIPEETIESEE